VIQLFNINNHIVDTSKYSHFLHDKGVTELEDTLKEYIGAKYACSINSATNAIFLSFLNKNTTVNIPSIIPPVVLNAVKTSGNKINFVDNIDWVGDSYVLHDFGDYRIVDSAQKLQKNQFKKECDPQDIMFFSFYPTKPLGGSDGGLIVSDDKEKIEWYRQAVLNGMSYSSNNWEREINFPGYKMYLSSIQADIVAKNFSLFEHKMRRLGEIVSFYNAELGYDNKSSHLYRISVDDNKSFISQMKEKGIVCGKHYDAMHKNPVYAGSSIFNCPKSEEVEKTTVSLPMNEALTDEQIEHIVHTVRSLI
jgi:dTDP-4-amino-4,6-dideoxygalactose transaminase